MEQLRVISESKEGRVPTELTKELPEIASIIERMLSTNPSKRPSLEEISHNLKLPIEMAMDLSGILYMRKRTLIPGEKSKCYVYSNYKADSRLFKLVGKRLYIFNKMEDKKAESVYDLLEWKIQLENMELELNKNTSSQSERGSQSSQTQQLNKDEGAENELRASRKEAYLSMENPFQFGCVFKGESLDKTIEIYEKLSKDKRKG